MVNANEWLNAKIPLDQRTRVTHLHIYKECQSGHVTHHDGCYYCNGKIPSQYSGPQQYQFYSTVLEGELDLNDFVNLQQLYIISTGQDQDQQQQLTDLRIDKCNKLTDLQISNNPISNITIEEPKRLESQVEKSTSIKSSSLDDIKLATKKMKKENLENQVILIKNKLGFLP
ncbi:26612_t:CDS:1 [Gigaspora margarita]|uniref:26612_t:CDS:1 n=1 Tax=Gigaspora margarita TaxID=4874 RepID=A0ABN7W6H4_GIGMA|nr:26612_t:CDS:1 [Gigaspora margarita]